MRKFAAFLVIGGCLWFAVAAVRGEEPAGPQHRVEVAVELKWPLEGSLSFFKHVLGKACEQSAPAATAEAPCPTDKFERIGIDFESLPVVGEHQILMFPPFVAAGPPGVSPPGMCMSGSCPQFGGVKFITGCPGECVAGCATAGCTAAKCVASGCTATGCAVKCSAECPCTPKASACACDDCRCGECKCDDCKCSPAAAKLTHAGLFEHLLEISVEKAALEAALEAHAGLAEERDEMFSTVAELMVENAKLTAKLEFQRERDELNKQLSELASQNVQLKAEIAVTKATAELAGASLQLALEKERLQSRVAELERQVQGDGSIRTAKRQKTTR